MNGDGNCHTRKYGYAFNNMVIVPSPGSIWDYPYLNQVTSMMGLVYGTRSKPEQDLFPSKIRIPEIHMESPSKFELTKTEVQIADETELGEVKVMPLTSNVATSTPVQPGGIPCKNGGCKSWASRAESRMESPWHFLKTIFLISVIVALILWVIVYTFLVQYQIL
ncbi:hypothetical protein HZU73_07830 [Apis mellifera caucasica]|uniref:Uncharacterized protein LOC725578 isoform X1 n=1 Tax=Apis mellifera TaxID=7460 RepID=A0A7M7MP94_APIME|nr:uncharacterized protein LOC725578 isoform X1 [Apis mellifera]XP_026298972.1 uncharacterized protein LOC725578 isoform X1 [Apis mellifera]KAG6796844.1 hypothetical protein HZU73_07830 [Apis mellifera caucasica]KAG9430545.1 hypothetical protein HZU67_07748 [Apis mellifera carnica]|eukprot:XP_006565580.1 uncharacterized protein LOC725578 isoform X1 [Apis mellifera]